MTDFSRHLNPEQLAAATAADGPLLILAAAGTGKTRTLAYRVAYLVEQGIAARNILLLTFTNRAAGEMLERAREIAGEQVGGIWGGTFHHVANRLLRRHAPLLGYPNDFTILDADEQKGIVAALMKAKGLTAKEFMKKEVLLGLVSHARNRRQDLHDFLEDRIDALEVDPAQIVAIAREYENRKGELKAMDFDDLLINALRLLREHEEVRLAYQRQFRHVLVDEFQDTNILQAEFTEMLAREHGNLSVVGDD
ncbi:MAG: UvrD-helicase domain-containing protein, partial [Kiritimatiellaeota bacterium]|nr:UvrD-helicase domain-containing protein [Kiritimatiellota bacterium]